MISAVVLQPASSQCRAVWLYRAAAPQAACHGPVSSCWDRAHGLRTPGFKSVLWFWGCVEPSPPCSVPVSDVPERGGTGREPIKLCCGLGFPSWMCSVPRGHTGSSSPPRAGCCCLKGSAVARLKMFFFFFLSKGCILRGGTC